MLALILLAAALAALAGCGGGNDTGTDGTPARTGEESSVTLAVFQEPVSLAPPTANLLTDQQILGALFDPLMYTVTDSEGNSEIVPGLAESVTASDDATVFTFKLRRGVKFHDGTPFNAEAVKATFDLIVDPETRAQNALSTLGPYERTRIIDDYTVEVVFERSFSLFSQNMTSLYLGMISPKAIKENGIAALSKKPVGTGAFVFDEWVAGNRVRVTRNEEYWGGPEIDGTSGPAQLDEVIFRILPDPPSQSNALRTGEITIAQTLNPPDIQSALDSGFKLYRAPGTGQPYVIDLNVDNAPTDDLRVRRALNHAIDPEATVETVFAGFHEAAQSVYDPATLGYDEESQNIYDYDPEAAKRLLDEAGWVEGSGGIREKGGQRLSLTMLNIADEGWDEISQVIQSQLGEVGVELKITEEAWPAVSDSYNEGDFHLGNHWDWWPSAGFVLSQYVCENIEGGFNWTHYCSPGWEELVERANAAGSEEEQAQLWAEVGAKLMEDAVVVPIYSKSALFVGPANLQGLDKTSGHVPFYQRLRYGS